MVKINYEYREFHVLRKNIKTDCLHLIEDYLQSRKDQWGLDEENPVNCSLSTREKSKRFICIELIKQINKAHKLDSFLNLHQQLSDAKELQHQDYRSGLKKFVNNEQEMIQLLDKLINVVSHICKDSALFDMEITKTNNQIKTFEEHKKNINESAEFFGIHNKARKDTILAQLTFHTQNKETLETIKNFDLPAPEIPATELSLVNKIHEQSVKNESKQTMEETQKKMKAS